MKKKNNKAVIAAVGIGVGTLAAAAMLRSCAAPAALYGPPPLDPQQMEDDSNLPEPVYGPPSVFDVEYDPSANIAEDVYGPPPLEEAAPEESAPTPAPAPAAEGGTT